MDEIKIINGTLPELVLNEILDIEENAKRYADMQKQMKAKLYKAMEEAGVAKIEMNGVNITFVAPTTSEKLDSKALKKDFPDIYNSYVSISERAGYVKISEVKNGKLEH